MNIRAELRRLPYLTVLVLVLVAVVVLVVRLVALLAAVVADGAERAESALAEACDTLPLGSRVVILPSDPRPATTHTHVGGVR